MKMRYSTEGVNFSRIVSAFFNFYLSLSLSSVRQSSIFVFISFLLYSLSFTFSSFILNSIFILASYSLHLSNPASSHVLFKSFPYLILLNMPPLFLVSIFCAFLLFLFEYLPLSTVFSPFFFAHFLSSLYH